MHTGIPTLVVKSWNMSALVSKWPFSRDLGYPPSAFSSLAPPLSLSIGTHYLGVFQTLLWYNDIQESILIDWCPCQPVINIFSIASSYKSIDFICKAFQTLTCVLLLGTKSFYWETWPTRLISISFWEWKWMLENKHHILINPIVV